jgi:hypothetical protein
MIASGQPGLPRRFVRLAELTSLDCRYRLISGEMAVVDPVQGNILG